MLKNRLTSALLILFLITIVFYANAQSIPASGDSLELKKKTGRMSITNLFNTGSMYYFTGVVSNNKPSFDTKFVYDNLRQNWGVLFFKSFDLVDRKDAINYALIVLNKRYFIGSRIMISPQAGAQLNQIGTIAGPGTDFLTNLSISYRFAKHITISNDAVMQNLVLTHRANWTNRMKLQYQKQSFIIAANMWHRNRIFNNPGYLAAGSFVSYSGIKLNSVMNLVMTFSQIKILNADTPRKNGMMLSVGLDF
ncbi:MAG: hypothetical protein Q8S11_08485 [Daejeonella sp.]|uniref:hypothetical protein n=1 Tax=Daejeonella sp. TaxID=2805397 RepID=UPI0027325122|nr:hypothetical protein [Daejeonella sp.]MDP3468358.1 hypothetical protein [Daejeonella sp.]